MLAGTTNDLLAMRAALTRHGFSITTLSGDRATRAGIRAAYRSLIASIGPEDAAVVYYTGHGARYRNRGTGPAWLRYLVTTDRAFVVDGEFTGLLAEELSLLQAGLTARTANVTVILDCCYAARMSRGPGFLPKAAVSTAGLPWEVIDRHYRQLRSAAAALDADSNPSAVRVVACGPEEVAFEMPASAGGPRSAMTTALAAALTRPGSEELSWAELIALIRPVVSGLIPGQRPEVEGPVTRQLFGLSTKERSGCLPVRVDVEGAYLPHPGLYGITEGDVYTIAVVGREQPAAIGTVAGTHGDRAPLVLDRALPAPALPLEARPLVVAVGRRPVAVVPPSPALVHELTRSVLLRPARPGEHPMVTVHADDLTVLDAAGEPLITPPTTVEAVAAQLARTARALHIRDLRSGSGPEALTDDIAATFTLLPDHPPALHGASVFLDDKIVARLTNQGTEPRFVSIFDIGLRGAVTLLTTSAPTGIALSPGDTYELLRDPASGELHGITMYWPDGLHRGGARPETFLVIVTDRPQDLRALEQHETRRRVPHSSALQHLIDDLVTGRRDYRGPVPDRVRYRVERLDFLLHPRPRPGPEPSFATDERPHLSVRLAPPGPVACTAVARLVNRSGTALHVLAATSTGGPGGTRHEWTTVAPHGAATVLSGSVHGSAEFAVWSAPTAPAAPGGDHGRTPGPLVDETAHLIRQVSARLPEAARIYRTTVVAGDLPLRITTDVFTLDMIA
jgi:hypothetical protein